MYLTSDIIHAAMERHHENSDSPDNVSDYCDIAVKAIALLRQYDLFLVNIEVKNKYPCRNGSNSTKERKRKKPPLSKLMMKDSYQSVHLCVLLS